MGVVGAVNHPMAYGLYGLWHVGHIIMLKQLSAASGFDVGCIAVEEKLHPVITIYYYPICAIRAVFIKEIIWIIDKLNSFENKVAVS